MQKVTKVRLSKKPGQSTLIDIHRKRFCILFYYGIFHPREFDFVEIHDGHQMSKLFFWGAGLFVYRKDTDAFDPPFIKLQWFPFGDSNLKLHWLWVLGIRKIKT